MEFPQYDFTYIQQAVNGRTRSSIHISITSKCEAISNILDITENLWWNKAMKKYLSWVTSWLSGTFNYQKTILTKLCFKLHWCFSSPEISVWKQDSNKQYTRTFTISFTDMENFIWNILMVQCNKALITFFVVYGNCAWPSSIGKCFSFRPWTKLSRYVTFSELRYCRVPCFFAVTKFCFVE